MEELIDTIVYAGRLKDVYKRQELNCPYELAFDNGLRPDELVSWTEKEKVNEELQCK